MKGKIFILTDKPRAFFTDNRYINPNDCKVITQYEDLDGVGEGIIIAATYDYHDSAFSDLEDRILTKAIKKGITYVDVKK